MNPRDPRSTLNQRRQPLAALPSFSTFTIALTVLLLCGENPLRAQAADEKAPADAPAAAPAKPATAAPQVDPGDTPEREPDPDHDWLTYYYQNPEPEKLVAQIRKWSDGRILSDERARPALVGFLSQVFRQNRDKIKEWHLEISDLPPEDMQTIRLALIFSRTSEGDEIITAGDTEGILEKRPPKVLEMSMRQLPTFDMLWGYFYATGSEEVIKRMIFLFRYEDMDLSAEADIPEGYSPITEQLPEAAHWALVSNAETHPIVLQWLENYYQTAGALEPIEKKGVRAVLSELLPAKYPAKSDDKKDAAGDAE